MESNNNEVSLTDISTENPLNTTVIETSLTESIIMNDVENQSTPIQSKKSDENEMLKMIQAMFIEQSIKSERNFDKVITR